MKVKPVLWSKAAIDGTHPLKIYVYKDKKRDYINTGLHINKRFWDSRFLKVTKDHPNNSLLNSKLQALINTIEKQLLSGVSVGNLSINSTGSQLIDFIDVYIKECEKGTLKRSAGRIKHYKTAKADIVNFCKTYGIIDFETINKNFYLAYVAYFRNKNLVDSTIGFKINVLKAILNEAFDRGLPVTLEHKKKYFKSPFSKSHNIYLSESDIEKILTIDLTNHKQLQSERDRFIISYYFLLRFGDSVSFDRSNFSKEGEQYFFNMINHKTKNNIVVPVKKEAIEILEKYNYELPVSHNHRANAKIKSIGKLAGLTEVINVGGKSGPKYSFISTHTARRSIATNLRLRGFDEKLIMDLGGWETPEMVRKYFKLSKLESAKMAAQNDFYK